jgi:hypothetical protein
VLHSLGELVRRLDTTSLYRILQHVQERLRTEEQQQNFKAWRTVVENARFERKDVLKAADCSFVLHLIDSRSDDDEWLNAR